MVDLVGRLDETTRKIHAGKDVHGFDDLKLLIDAVEDTCAKGLKTRVLEPFSEYASNLQQEIAHLGRTVAENEPGQQIVLPYEFVERIGKKSKFKFIVTAGPNTLSYLAQTAERFEELIAGFSKLFVEACEDLEFEVFPAERISQVKKRIIPPERGRFMILGGRQYHLVNFNYRREGRRMVGTFEQASEKPLSYYRALAEPFTHGVVMVRNTQRYPLVTSLAATLTKYGMLLEKKS